MSEADRAMMQWIMSQPPEVQAMLVIGWLITWILIVPTLMSLLLFPLCIIRKLIHGGESSIIGCIGNVWKKVFKFLFYVVIIIPLSIIIVIGALFVILGIIGLSMKV